MFTALMLVAELWKQQTVRNVEKRLEEPVIGD